MRQLQDAVCGVQVEQEALGRLWPLFYAWVCTAFLAAGDCVLPRCDLDKVMSLSLHWQQPITCVPLIEIKDDKVWRYREQHWLLPTSLSAIMCPYLHLC